MDNLYADGGVIGPNPSPRGGTYAWLAIAEDAVTAHGSGIITPQMAGLPTVSNNYTELYAAVCALESREDGWAGVIHTDSFVTVCRIRNRRPSFRGIPYDLQERLWTARGRLGKYKVVLLDGHPTRAHLEAGRGKRGQPVSKWNKACDLECTRLAKTYWVNQPLGVLS